MVPIIYYYTSQYPGYKVSPLTWSISIGQNADHTSGLECILMTHEMYLLTLRFLLKADELLKVRKEKALIQTTLDEMRVKHKRDVEALKENIRKSHSEMDAARKLHETEILIMKDTLDRREEELKLIRAEAVKASQVG